MSRNIRRPSLGWLGQIFLIALLLVPVALSAHHHADPAGSSDCATCAVVHHGPTATAPSLTLSAPHGSAPIVPTTVDAPAAFVWVQRLGRAPPFALLSCTI